MGALRFSPKQRQVLTWWREGSPHWEKSAIICDGAVRSGKTLCLGLSFFLLGHGPLPGAEIRPVRPEHGGGAAEPDGRGAAPVERDGIPVPGAADPGGGDGVPGAAAEHLLPVRRRGRGGGGTASRG